jgi:hypothetical protein
MTKTLGLWGAVTGLLLLTVLSLVEVGRLQTRSDRFAELHRIDGGQIDSLQSRVRKLERDLPKPPPSPEEEEIILRRLTESYTQGAQSRMYADFRLRSERQDKQDMVRWLLPYVIDDIQRGVWGLPPRRLEK